MSPIDYKQIASTFIDRRDLATRDEDVPSVNDCVMVQPDHYHRVMMPNSSASKIVRIDGPVGDCASSYCKEHNAHLGATEES